MEFYDMCFSIGPACRPSYYIRNYGYRDCAYPMDWMECNISDTLKIYKKDFKDFFIAYEDISNKVHCDEGRRCVLDKIYNIKDMHHFNTEFSIEEQLQEYRIIMKRRYERFKQDISKANSVLIIANYMLNYKVLEDFLVEFSEIYSNKKMTLVNVNSTMTTEVKCNTYNISKHLRIDEYCFLDINKDGSDYKTNPKFWIGNEDAWIKLLKNYAINNIVK